MAMIRALVKHAIAACGATFIAFNIAAAQSLGLVPGRDVPEWLESWSPLAQQGDLPRRLPSASTATPLLLLPLPRIGLFWSGGNPAALAWDVTDSRADISAVRALQDGELRRPLDPASSALTQLTGMGWQPLPKLGAGIGRVTFGRDVRDPSSVSDLNEPYPSSPFVITDTTVTALRRTRARLEAAGGWRVGGWGLGVALGHDARNTATVAAPFARRNRAVFSAATVGLSRASADGRYQVGARAQLKGGEETVGLSEIAEQGIVFELVGYREVPVRDIQGFYTRRVTREVRSGGIGAAARVGRGQVVVFADATRSRERPTSQQRDNPASDLWATSGGMGGISAQFPLFADRVLFAANGRFTKLSGRAKQVLLSPTGFDADERALEGSVEARYSPATAPWMGVAKLSLLSDRRERNDSVAQANTVIQGTTPGAAVELGRRLGVRLLIVGGYAISAYSGSGTIPSAASRGPVYRRLIAPELAIATTGTRAQAFSFAARYAPRESAAVWVAGRSEIFSSDNASGSLVPLGNRTANTIWVGVTLGGGS